MKNKLLLEQLVNGEMNKREFIRRMKLPVSVSSYCWEARYDDEDKLEEDCIIEIQINYNGAKETEKRNVSFTEYKKLKVEWESVNFGTMICFVDDSFDVDELPPHHAPGSYL
jgi:hypothetical protein